MATHKNIDRICAAALVFALLLALALLTAAGRAGTGRAPLGYEGRLFDSGRVHNIDIVIDGWDSFLADAESEAYTACAVVIDGEAERNVAIRAKGNTSLSQVARSGSQRYSFKVEFDHYDSANTYHGLDKLSLNNLIQDDTCMKDYLAYRLMGDFGVAAPLCSYAWLTVNGQDWGLYLAVEGVEESFLRRNYGNGYGELYKPDSAGAGGGRGNGRGFDWQQFQAGDAGGSQPDVGDAGDAELPAAPEGAAPADGSDPLAGGSAAPAPEGAAPQEPPALGGSAADATAPAPQGLPEGAAPAGPGGRGGAAEGAGLPGQGAIGGGRPGRQPDGLGGGHGGMDSADLKLQYIDDDPASYPNIFDNAKTTPTDADKARLVAALKTLGGSDPTAALDAEAVARYLVVHGFLCNDDSYTGAMVHNYYLYEQGGRLSMIPWDYNLAFGGFGGGSAQDAVNAAIDDALSDRPMQSWLFADDANTALYHTLYSDFLAQYFDGATQAFDALVAQTAALIGPYVQKDPTAFCSYADFTAAVAALRQFGALRAQSVAGQLAGSIPATSAAQRQDSAALVDASGLDLSAMGGMGAMDGMGGARGPGRAAGAAGQSL